MSALNVWVIISILIRLLRDQFFSMRCLDVTVMTLMYKVHQCIVCLQSPALVTAYADDFQILLFWMSKFSCWNSWRSKKHYSFNCTTNKPVIGVIQVCTRRVTHSSSEIVIGPVSKNNHKQGCQESPVKSRLKSFPAIDSINGKTSVFPGFEVDLIWENDFSLVSFI